MWSETQEFVMGQVKIVGWLISIDIYILYFNIVLYVLYMYTPSIVFALGFLQCGSRLFAGWNG